MKRRRTSKLLSNLLQIALLLALTTAHLAAQEGSASDPRRPIGPEDQIGSPAPNLPYYSPKEPVNCEVAGVYLDDAIARAKRAEDTYFIVIARLGDGERSRSLNGLRLATIRNYLMYHPTLKSVTAEGERVDGYGRLELYVGGKLLYTMPIRRNRNVNVLGCIAP